MCILPKHYLISTCEYQRLRGESLKQTFHRYCYFNKAMRKAGFQAHNCKSKIKCFKSLKLKFLIAHGSWIFSNLVTYMSKLYCLAVTHFKCCTANVSNRTKSFRYKVISAILLYTSSCSLKFYPAPFVQC